MGKKKNKGSIGINIDAPSNFDSLVLADIAAGFVEIMEAGAASRLEQGIIIKAIEEYASVVYKATPSLSISNCSIINGEVQ